MTRERTEMHTEVWREDLKEEGRFKDDTDCSIDSVSHLSCPRAWPLLRDVQADPGFLCDKAAVLGDIIKRTTGVIMDATEIGWKNVEWIHLARDMD